MANISIVIEARDVEAKDANGTCFHPRFEMDCLCNLQRLCDAPRYVRIRTNK